MSEYRLSHGDCLDILPALADRSMDAVIADIPSGRTACAWDTVIPFDLMWAQLKRIIKPKGAIVLLGCTQPFTSALVMSNPEMFRYDWIWQKPQGTNFADASRQPLRAHESILVFSTGAIVYHPQMRAAPARISGGTGGGGGVGTMASFRSQAQAQRTRTRKAPDRYPLTVLHFGQGQSTKGLHPTQKPLLLLEYLVKTYTHEGDVVLDFCYGSGTTGAACGNLERSFVGIEKDTEYFTLGRERIATAYAPLRHMQQVG